MISENCVYKRESRGNVDQSFQSWTDLGSFGLIFWTLLWFKSNMFFAYIRNFPKSSKRRSIFENPIFWNVILIVLPFFVYKRESPKNGTSFWCFRKISYIRENLPKNGTYFWWFRKTQCFVFSGRILSRVVGMPTGTFLWWTGAFQQNLDISVYRETILLWAFASGIWLWGVRGHPQNGSNYECMDLFQKSSFGGWSVSRIWPTKMR